MNLILDTLPDSAQIGGETVPLNTDFRNAIVFELLMQRPGLPNEVRIVEAIRLFYPDLFYAHCFANLDESIRELLNFYAGEIEAGSKQKKKDSARILDYEADGEYIYAAFRQQYGIDLNDEKLHWHKFKALFKSLNKDCKISEIMHIRAMEITQDMSDSDRKYYREMKELYALPDMRTQEEKEADFAEALF